MKVENSLKKRAASKLSQRHSLDANLAVSCSFTMILNLFNVRTAYASNVLLNSFDTKCVRLRWLLIIFCQKINRWCVSKEYKLESNSYVVDHLSKVDVNKWSSFQKLRILVYLVHTENSVNFLNGHDLNCTTTWTDKWYAVVPSSN